MAGGIERVGAGLDQETALLGVERRQEDRIELAAEPCGMAAAQIQEVTTIGKKMRPPMAGFAPRGVDPGHCLRHTASRGDAMNRADGAWGKEDGAGAVPASSPSVGSGTDRNGRSSGKLDPAQLAAREEPERSAVRRPERMGAILRAGNGARREGVEGTEPEDPRAGAVGGAEDERPTVGRNRHRPPARRPAGGEETLLRRRDGKGNGASRWRRVIPRRPVGHQGGGERGRGDDPGEPLAPLREMRRTRRRDAGLTAAPLGDPLQL